MQSVAEIQTRLAETRAAISSILNTGQAMSTDGRSLSQANLESLQKHEEWLEAKLAVAQRAANGGGRNRVSYITPE
jgi:hypothetical protein